MNPFILNTYYQPDLFCDREMETDQIINAIKNGRNIAVISRRRMGKTSLIKHINYKVNQEKSLKFTYFDIMATNSLQEFVNKFSNALLNPQNSKIQSIINTMLKTFAAFKPTMSINPLTNDTKFTLELNSIKDAENSLELIFEFLKNSKNQYVIAIDEFQQILNYDGIDLESVLRSYIQHLSNVCFIYSGSSKHILGEMFNQQNRPFYMSSDILYLEKINQEKYIDFILNKFGQGKKKIFDDAIERIFSLTNGHTYYVHLLCNRIYALDNKKIASHIVDNTFIQILNESRVFFENYKNLLSDFQWKLLKAIATENTVESVLSSLFINKYNLGATSSVQTALKSLENKELVIKENGLYQIDDLLFSKWLTL